MLRNIAECAFRGFEVKVPSRVRVFKLLCQQAIVRFPQSRQLDFESSDEGLSIRRMDTVPIVQTQKSLEPVLSLLFTADCGQMKCPHWKCSPAKRRDKLANLEDVMDLRKERILDLASKL